MEYSIRFIGEGVTDFQVIRNILVGYFKDPDINFESLQPEIDKTDQQTSAGNWLKVLNYCASEKFRGSFSYTDYVIIQIDTDACDQKHFDIPNGKTLKVEELVLKVKEKIVSAIGEGFYKKVQKQVLFAISVHELECWLLPIYYPNEKSKKVKTSGCLGALNQALSKKFGFTIDKTSKNFNRQYEEISKPFRKSGDLAKYSKENPSFSIFYKELSKIKV